MKKVLMIVICFFLLAGCNKEKPAQSNDLNEMEETKVKSYKRDQSSGEVIAITLDQMQQMINEKKTFALVFTTTYCGYCAEFHAVFDEYIKTHHVLMYEVILDHEDRSEKENLEIILPYFPEFYSTPSVFYVKDGKKESYLDFSVTGMDESVIDHWVQTYQLDKKTLQN